MAFCHPQKGASEQGVKSMLKSVLSQKLVLQHTTPAECPILLYGKILNGIKQQLQALGVLRLHSLILHFPEKQVLGILGKLG